MSISQEVATSRKDGKQACWETPQDEYKLCRGESLFFDLGKMQNIFSYFIFFLRELLYMYA